MSNVPPLDPGETRAFRLGQASAYDYLVARLGDLIRELRRERTSLVLPTRKPPTTGDQR
ncbi:MAG: hypothetical protein ACRDTM_11215 [Micromonosporaceae bacterium]